MLLLLLLRFRQSLPTRRRGRPASGGSSSEEQRFPHESLRGVRVLFSLPIVLLVSWASSPRDGQNGHPTADPVEACRDFRRPALGSFAPSDCDTWRSQEFAAMAFQAERDGLASPVIIAFARRRIEALSSGPRGLVRSRLTPSLLAPFRLRTAHMLRCREVAKLVSDSLDRQLPFWQRIGVRVHLLMCKACACYERQLLFLRRASGLLGERLDSSDEPAALAMPPQVKERILNSLKYNT